MAVFNSLTIGGINSLDYGIYITGEGVYDAPNRAVEMVEIHGRNGALILDKGHFENIEIKYPCGSFGEGNKTFEQRITEFKNAVLSLKGYQRLTDTYATDVYRLASCANGFEVAPVQGGKAGEFDLVFNCKPQRFLTSGETLVTVANNGTLTNPTAFDSQPTIQVNGYGTLTFNGYEVTIENALMGEVELLPAFTSGGSTGTIDFTDRAKLTESGDTITLEGFSFAMDVYVASSSYSSLQYTSHSISSTNIPATSTASGSNITSTRVRINANYGALSFTKGSGDATYTDRHTFTFNVVGSNTVSRSIVFDITLTLKNSASNGYKFSIACGGNMSRPDPLRNSNSSTEVGALTADSTQSILGNPTVIDCELGEAYKVENNQFISLNAYIDLGSDLPVLASGTNTFTKSNTITSLKVKPNWWKL